MRRFHFHVRRALIAAACLAAAFPSPTDAADAPEGSTIRALMREYFKDRDGAELGQLIGYQEPVKKVIALDYKVLLLEDGREKPVDPKLYEFRLGDRIRISIEPLADYYVYIFNIGSDGQHRFLLPDERRDEAAPLIRAGRNVALPQDGYIRFAPPAGTDRLLVVATEQRVADRATLAELLTKKPGEELTPKQKKLNDTIKATVKEALISVEERRKAKLGNIVMYRGLSTEDQREELTRDVKARKVKEGTFEETSKDAKEGTSAMYISTSGKGTPRLLVSIPLRSVERKP